MLYLEKEWLKQDLIKGCEFIKIQTRHSTTENSRESLWTPASSCSLITSRTHKNDLVQHNTIHWYISTKPQNDSNSSAIKQLTAHQLSLNEGKIQSDHKSCI